MVEPGADPLYVVIASHGAIIWQFSGAVERIERVVLSSALSGPNSGERDKRPLVGATGLPADRVSFMPRPGCLNYFDDAPSTKSATATGMVRREAGKEPVVTAAKYSVLTFHIPSGEMQPAREDRNAGKLIIQKNRGTLKIEGDASNVIIQSGPSNLVSEFNRFSPGGIVDIDPTSVIASQPAERYEVLPQQAGLIQLVKAGTLSQNRSGELLIHKKMRFPAGLHGAHSVKFLLLRGVPMPDGDPGHSDVIVEETGEPLRRR
jgi:hypothetical protein